MESLATSQAHVFLIFVLNGIIIAFVFDIFRICRKSFQTPDWVTYLEDILFWFITCVLLAYSIYTFNNGEIRLYMIFGIIIGAILYILTISKYIIKFSVKIIMFFKKIIDKILHFILYPIKIVLKTLKKVLLRPICFVFVNFRKGLYKFLQKNVKKSIKAEK